MSVLESRNPDEFARVSLPAARAALLAGFEPIGAELVPLSEATGRIAARALLARDDLVPFARSAMDGYACRAADTHAAAATSPLVLPVTGAVYAGDVPLALAPNAVIAIATGAPLPSGADAVVPFEEIVRIAERITLVAPLAPGDHVFPAGDDAKHGETMVHSGETITPGRAAFLAAAGYATVPVYRRPRVAIVTTGNEVVDVAEVPGFGHIRNSNAAMLAAFLRNDGATIATTEHVDDTAAALRAALERAHAASDLILTTGGASTGERDLVKTVLRELGARFAFDSVAVRPAKPTGFARWRGRPVVVLAGNPAAAYVGYAALARGAVRRLAGRLTPYQPPIPATLDGTIHLKKRRHFLIFGALEMRDGALRVRPLENQCSSLVRTSADANALIVTEPGSGTLQTGDRVVVEVLDWSAVPVTSAS